MQQMFLLQILLLAQHVSGITMPMCICFYLGMECEREHRPSCIAFPKQECARSCSLRVARALDLVKFHLNGI